MSDRDIVDRLSNEWAEYENDPERWRGLCEDARDEITALRKRLAELEGRIKD